MKKFKYTLCIGLFYSIILLSNCGNNDDPIADILTNNDALDDDSNTIIDADGDGVTDADDTCADTPDGSIVDSNGCSDSQKDTDGDGVTDDLDACADTPEVAMVDENGCELTFIYLDQNGITIKATENAVVGENYELDGISYLVIDSAMLYQMIFDKKDVSKVVTSFVTNMNGMFKSDTLFNQDIGSWDVSNVEIMNGMFEEANSFNQNIGSWDVSSVKDIRKMFSSASSFDQDISSWNVSNVTQMNNLFKSTPFNQDIGSWDVSNVEIMNRMFEKATSFNQDISGWDVSNVTQMKHMFDSASNFNQDLNSWNVSNVIECSSFGSNTTNWLNPKPNFTNCLSGEVWIGDIITFSKEHNTDPNLAENQDRITNNVWITRGPYGQIYNIVTEEKYDKQASPKGTEWAEGSILNYASLTYAPFRSTTVKPKNSVGKTFVVHLIQDDIYLSLKMLSWKDSSGYKGSMGAGFSYERSTK